MKSLTTPLTQLMRGLTLAALLCAAPSAIAAPCTALPELETQLQSQPNAGGYLRLAHWFDENHQTNCAIEAFQSALNINPASVAALDGMAKVLIAAGDYEAVVRRLPAAPHDQNLILDLALAYRRAEMFDDAARVLTQGLKLYPASDSLTDALVTLSIHVNHSEAATALAEKLARQKPHDLEAQRIYLRALVNAQRNDQATALGHRLLVLAPHDADFLFLNGMLERTAGSFSLARKHLEESVALSPNFYNSRYNLGVVLAHLQDPAGAEEQLKKALKLGATEPEVHFELSKVLNSLGEAEEAREELKVYKKGLQEESDRAVAVLKSTQAEEASKAGDEQKAAGLYREACAAQPGNVGLAYRLALALNATGDIAGERATLERAVQTDPEFSLAQYQLGALEFRNGEVDVAEQQFRLAVKSTPSFVQAWVALAACLAVEYRVEEAQEAVAQALRLEPNNASALSLSKKLPAAHQHQ
jgi:Flp pilus assembly protein TadD